MCLDKAGQPKAVHTLSGICCKPLLLLQARSFCWSLQLNSKWGKNKIAAFIFFYRDELNDGVLPHSSPARSPKTRWTWWWLI